MASYQSLYRRYRPQRFDEVLGQEHITKALRNAVRDGRVGHAYLFSGPRGTGKTSTARVLAKVLNCAAPVDGEPCGQCESCVAVADGRVTDWLLEQDAASKSKVDDMRDLLERVPLGTSGNRKVIILDEVHMLSQGAENALLKTLEEPPSHVVFVLATTDPQKVRPTIRSRTQHFEFRLLPPDVMADHVRHVIADADLGLADDEIDHAVDHVIRAGGGSARDTLSALDQVAALGEVVDETEPVDAVLDALCERDPGKVLVAVADALASGRDPRTLGEGVIAGLRDAFLSVMGAAEDHLTPAERDRAARVGEALGPAGLTRALDVLGEALVELARKPDPRIVVEVALVRITQPAADRTLDAVIDRLDRLERGGGAPGAGGTPPPIEPPDLPPPGGAGGRPATAARDALAKGGTRQGAATGKPTLGSVARRGGKAKDANGTGPPPTDAAPPPPEASAPAPDTTEAEPTQPAAAAPPAAPAPASADVPGLGEVEAAWSAGVLAGLPVKIRSKWRGGRWVDPGPDGLRFAVPNSWHQSACDESRRDVERALAAHFGSPVGVTVVVEGDGGGGSGPAPAGGQGPGPGPAPSPEPEDEHIDPSELRDAGDVATTGVDLLLREFGGQVEEEP
jgi:DNA polymerase III subunit gamma/tau